MSLLTLVVVALGVSADAFAVALGKGLQRRGRDLRQAALVAAVFGAFQALMPLLGWLVGSRLEDVVTSYDHWIAFGLLAAVGGKMLHEAVAARDEGGPVGAALGWRELLVLALATSVDALAVGITFAFLPVAVLPAVLLIGAVTLVVSFAGGVLGQRAGRRWQRPAEVAGGLVLVAIGVKILVDHLSA